MRNSICLLFLIGYTASAQTPVVSSVVGAASFTVSPAAAGSLITIFGSNLAADTAVPAAPLPTSLKGVSVKIGTYSAPIQYLSPSQINVQVPWELSGTPKAALTVTSNGATSASQDIALAPTAPGTFGAIPAATRTYTAVRQGEYLAIFCTGLGDVMKPPATGAIAQGDANPTKAAVSVSIGGTNVTPAFAGLAPAELLGYDSVGLYEVDVLVPANATTGSSIPVNVTAGGVAGNPIMIPIAPASNSQVIAQWTQMASSGALARAVTSTTVCPTLMLDGKATAMQTRSAATLPFYPVQGCEAAIPSSTASASINGGALPLPSPNAKRITSIADTGCRMDATRLQACNDPLQWPAGIVAASAAATKPDLILQLGDLHYREVPCPVTNAGCAGSPWGYNWAVWNADFFSSMAPIFSAAPLVLVRGNHEMCSRAGEGWMRYLDPNPPTATCNQFTDPYTVQAGPTQIFVMDSSEATDTTADPALVAHFTPQFDKLKQVVTPNTWVIMHHPIWAFDSTGTRNLSLQTACGNALPDGVQLSLSGHIHTFQTLNFAPARTPQMVAGNGGDVLQAYAATLNNFNGMTVGNATVTDSSLYKDFGFTTFDWTGTNWTALSRDIFGGVVQTCTVGSGSIVCK